MQFSAQRRRSLVAQSLESTSPSASQPRNLAAEHWAISWQCSCLAMPDPRLFLAGVGGGTQLHPEDGPRSLCSLNPPLIQPGPQKALTRGDSAHWTLTMSRNICSCRNWGAPGIKWVVARDAAQPPTAPKLAPHREGLEPDVISTDGSDPVFTMGGWGRRSLTAAHSSHQNKPLPVRRCKPG